MKYLLTVSAFVLALLGMSYAMQRQKRDGCDAKAALVDELVRKDAGFHSVFTFTNDSNNQMLLTWAGKNSEVIVLVTLQSIGLIFFSVTYASNVYSSVDGGLTFQSLTKSFGDRLVVRPTFGLQVNQLDRDHILILANENSKLRIWVSTNAGISWLPSTTLLDNGVLVNEPLTFYPREPAQEEMRKVKRWLLAHAVNGDLYSSLNGGLSWSLVASNVLNAKWGTPLDSVDAVYLLTLEKGSISSDGYQRKFGCCSLRKLQLETNESHVLLPNAHSFTIEETYVFASIWDSSSQGVAQGRRILKVSSDGGNSFQSVQLPTATPDTFYSVLAVDANQTFIHVDEPGATGSGVLYVSDATGSVYSESLRNHFYPDYIPMNDFIRVHSMRGTYLSTAINADRTMYSVVTFNRGAEWKRLSKPEGVECAKGVDPSLCGLQITSTFALGNFYSPVRGSAPLSSETARGVLLVHGHTSSTIDTADPDVYLSTDGGYRWKRVLNGPHHYQIAHFGALLVAFPFDSNNRKLQFSADGGSCWHQSQFDTQTFSATGLLTAPGNKELTVALWGFTALRQWQVHVFRFDKLLTKPCEELDYETWVPHVRNVTLASPTDGCLLGSRDIYKRLRSDSWCAANRSNSNSLVSSTVCSCTKDDFDCAYGYYRPTTKSAECVKHPNITALEVCLRGHLEDVVSNGYSKIPGDLCVGGYEPHYLDEQLMDLKRECDDTDKTQRQLKLDDTASKLQAARNQENTLLQQQSAKENRSVLVAVCVIAAVTLLAFLAFVTFRTRRRQHANRTYRYSRVPMDDESAQSLLPPTGQSPEHDAMYDDDEPLIHVGDEELIASPQDITFLPPNSRSVIGGAF